MTLSSYEYEQFTQDRRTVGRESEANPAFRILGTPYFLAKLNLAIISVPKCNLGTR
jgi:hypothetical protein